MISYSSNRPVALEKCYGGRCLYHYDIEEVMETDEEGNVSTQYQYQEVEVFEPLSTDKIIRAVIRDRWNNDVEQKLINEYLASKSGLYEDKDAEARYKSFLEKREAIKEEIKAVCKAEGVN